jgi:hypothetical protein
MRMFCTKCDKPVNTIKLTDPWTCRDDHCCPTCKHDKYLTMLTTVKTNG